MKRPRKTQYPGLSLLGRSEAALPVSPDKARLETFPNPRPGREYWIRLECPDFTSLCPVTGQPDFASVTIEYVPGAKCLETKALKLYLASFRNQPSFNEQVINRIADDLARACGPRKMKIEGKFAPRGGISLAVVVEIPPGGAKEG